MSSNDVNNSLTTINLDSLGINLTTNDLNTCDNLSSDNSNAVSLFCLVNSNNIQPAVKLALSRFRPIQPQPNSQIESQTAVTLLQNMPALNENAEIINESTVLSTNSTHSAQNSTIQVEQVHIAGYFCNICNCFYQCSTHCPAHTEPDMVILDSPIPSRAKLTLPKQLYLHQSGVVAGAKGVWSRGTIAKKTQFGPFLGKIIDKSDIGDTDISCKLNLWKIFNDGQLSHGIETSDESQCNWLMFLQRARTSSEQNVVAFLMDSQIFFMTTDSISADSELLFWFSADYCQLLEIPVKPEDGFSCAECSKRFISASSLERHKRYLHASTAGRKFQCSTCQKFFSSATKLSVHTLGHMGIKPHCCSYCNKQFTDASNLRSHLSIHTGERRFECTICSKTFRQKAHLTSHLLTHSGEKKHKCRYCDRWFARLSDLRQHETTHTCDRQFPCPVCNKIFYRLQTQKKHLKVHAGQRDFECVRCSKKFFTKYHLDRHAKSCRGKEDQTSTCDENL